MLMEAGAPDLARPFHLSSGVIKLESMGLVFGHYLQRLE
jgi:hypothetical protein